MMLKEFAQKLNGREYGWPQFTKEELAIAKENGFIIVHGASDDLMEIELNREQFEKLKTVNGGDRARFYCKETKECFTLYND